ncbi:MULTISPECIES: MBL fold metallo-hydrolase [unclassified Paracoccus (in: a-proteobacteria)]|uniref:MBL fold metallo-hydrolase n=1 Tax=unclassified Paracoccus (in: a-proteobacteria) TaxID=2688777 RepID=UPI0016020446|nr:MULTISPECIES: MBL fold metallo-hydrolase [unclassified Paracoccus (in: a-proteobacteria)]MBB1492149.1 MBL fold metallo-hydrolase [Paracoccus sp. MC1854]MBB1498568.1 MBL fold metallo-hydrolase [Paracoccus sp. MC1862]QQO44177.1 MBL fold metallo-hydrolase [Paracoccus sp. MC1862]
MSELRALGGFDAKGPACFLLDIGGRRLLLDLGRGPDAGRCPDLDGVGPVDAVLISHGHGDHTGALGMAERLGCPPIHATAPVRALAPDPHLQDARDLPRDGMVAGVRVESGRAGHAPGAVWIRIGGTEGMLYSGDFAAPSRLFPADPMPLATVAVLDCSYGLRAETLDAQLPALLDVIGRGPCLLPAPADGRGPELALACLEAGLTVRFCDQTCRTAQTLQGFGDWLGPSGAKALERLLHHGLPLDPQGPLDGIMIAAGPNCGSGAARILGPRAIAAGVPVIFTGHLAQGSPAEGWVADGCARRMGWNVHPDRATLSAALAQVRPAQALAAFALPESRHAVAAAFPGIRWTGNGRIAW